MAIVFVKDVPKHGFAEGDVATELSPESENHWLVRGAAVRCDAGGVSEDVSEPVADPEPEEISKPRRGRPRKR